MLIGLICVEEFEALPANTKNAKKKIVIFFCLKKIIDHVVEGLEGGNEDDDGISRGWLS